MLQFRQIKHKTQTELTRLFPKITIKPFIKKSNILQPVFKVIPCPALSPSIFKSTIESLNKPTPQTFTQLHQTLKHTQQYFTACINILEHNQRVRQRYQLLLSEEDKEKQLETRELKDLIRNAGTVSSKSGLVEFAQKKGHVVMGCDDRTKERDNSNKSKINSTSTINNRLSNTNTTSSQLKQLYLPLNPDQYSFITSIQQDQYLRYHQQTVQKLLILLTTINKLNRQLSQFITQTEKINQQLPLMLVQALKQLLGELAVEEMFRVQDNRYSQVVKYLLKTVYEQSRKIEKRKNSVEYYRAELKQAFIRVFYMEFIARKELQSIKTTVIDLIKANNQLLQQIVNNQNIIQSKHTNNNKNLEQSQQRSLLIKKINLKQLNNQLKHFTQLTKQIKQLSDYLCDKQQTVFKSFYDRKITKVILSINQVKSLILIGCKVNKKLLQLGQNEEIPQRQSHFSTVVKQSRFSTVYKSQKQVIQKQKLIKQEQTSLKQQIEKFFQQLCTVQKQAKQFIKSLTSKKNRPAINNPTTKTNQQQIHQSTFTKIFNKLQNLQLLFSTLQIKQTQSPTIIIKPQLTTQVKTHILDTQTELISGFKRYSLNYGVDKLFINYIPQTNQQLEEDDRASIVSGMSKSSKSSIFVFRKLQLTDVILSPPALSYDHQNKAQQLSMDQLISQFNDFITHSFTNNHSLTNQLQDLNNINHPQLLSFIQQINNLSQSFLKFNIKPVQQQPKTPVKSKSPQKQQKTQSPQKKKSKARPTKQKQKSPNKSPVNNNNSKPPGKVQQKPVNPIQAQENIKKQALSLLKNKLQFIKQILLPEVSQSRVSRIFQHNFQAQIFGQLSNILNSYKLKITTEKAYAQAQRYGFRTFLQSRIKFLSTITKDMKQLKQVLIFVRMFSQQKIKLQASEQVTYNLVLRALLAQKEIQAYRRENTDLALANKLSQSGVRFLQNQIYTPFLHMLKHLLKIVSTDDMLIKELQAMLQSVRAAIDTKHNLMKLVDDVIQGKLLILGDIKKRIEQLAQMYSGIRKFTILRFKRLQSMIRRLRYSLTIQPKNRNEDKIVLMKNYMKDKLQPKQQQQQEAFFF